MIRKIMGLVITGALLFGVSYGQAVLKVGTNPAYPPFEFKDEANNITGFDIELMNALCQEMNRECVYVEQAFDALIPNLRLKRFDAIISGMDITDERKKQVSFSDPYYLNFSIFVALKEKEDALKPLEEERIGVLSGSTHQDYIRKTYPDAKVSVYPQYPAAINDLLIGRVNVVFGDGEVVADYVKDEEKLTVYGEKVTDETYFGQGLGIAMRHQDEALREAINEALGTVKENGTYEALYSKWFEE